MTFLSISPNHPHPVGPTPSSPVGASSSADEGAASFSDGDEIAFSASRAGSDDARTRGGPSARAESPRDIAIRSVAPRAPESYRELQRRARLLDRELHLTNVTLSEIRDAVCSVAPQTHEYDPDRWTADDARSLTKYQTRIVQQYGNVRDELRKWQRFGPDSDLPQAHLNRRAASRLLDAERDRLGLSQSTTERLARHPDVVRCAALHDRLPSSSVLDGIACDPSPAHDRATPKSIDASSSAGRRVRGGSHASTSSFASFTYEPPTLRHEGFRVAGGD